MWGGKNIAVVGGGVAGLTVAPVPDFGDAEVTQTRLSSFRVHEVGIHLGSRLSF